MASSLPSTGPVLILGGGINGAAIARELSLQGVPVWLVDRADLNYGATAYSTRLIHGGLRYLEYGEFSLVRESLEERNRLLKLAPDFVRPLKLYIPVRKRWGGLLPSAARFLRLPASMTPPTRERGMWLVRAGLAFYDQFARRSSLPSHSVHAIDEPQVPVVDSRRFRWLCAYYDGQIPATERFVLALLADAREAARERGVDFRVLTYHDAVLHGDQVELRRELLQSDSLGETIATLRPAVIINATGAWVDATLRRLPVESRRLMGGTKGSHFVTFRRELREALGDGGVYAEAPDGRPVFVLPFGEGSLVGTTDLPFHDDPAAAVATDEELDYLVQAVNELFPQVRCTRSDVSLHYSGVRPLPYVDASSPAAVTRRHWLESHPDAPIPLYSVIGGKLTTCRSLAEEAAEVVLRHFGRIPTHPTRERPIVDPLPGLDMATLQTGPLPSRDVVRRMIREEWVERLDDLVERRLLAHFRRELTRQDLLDLAAAMTAEGKLAPVEVEDAVDRVRDRLTRHFGRTVN